MPTDPTSPVNTDAADYVEMIAKAVLRIGPTELDQHSVARGREAMRWLQRETIIWHEIDSRRPDDQKTELELARDALVRQATVRITDRTPKRVLVSIADAYYQLERSHADRVADLRRRREQLLSIRAVTRPDTGLLRRLGWEDSDLMTASFPLSAGPRYLDRLEPVIVHLEQKLAAKVAAQTPPASDSTNLRRDPRYRQPGDRRKRGKRDPWTTAWTPRPVGEPNGPRVLMS